MNSEERRAARRARRDAKRAANRARRIESCTLEQVADVDNLYRCARACSGGVCWKASVQRYMARCLPNVRRARDDLLLGKDIRRGFFEFDICERGKMRHITSVHFSERVIHKAINRYALVPAIIPTVTAGCSANIKGRGTEYALRRLKRQLARHYQKHGREGYILLVDFSNYFGNIDHDAAKRFVDRCLDDERLKRLVYAQIDAHGSRGLGLGSEPNQVLAVALPSPIDHMLLRTPCVLASGRYMDDTYCIALDKADLHAVMEDIRQECDKLGIVINEKKTRIVKLSRGFTYLKKRFEYGKNGKVIVRPCRAAVTRERRKLKKLAVFVERGEMTREQAVQSYQSWRSSMLKLDARRTVRSMDALFSQLFG
ncbi:RNA-directed DNA polymerase [Olsenella sp. Marseille-P4559]|uniref:RNA-directed DNA polymerase n=1 Tax=Olsenella sp. Marseille-P4559 TaxID=2364795 RepID=UPI0010302977|nr:RNA-directed DNA polymerase [Olsenella sp. Marseille-P4559]